jgi:RNA polymerase sigma factor for flagellar operon FliA
MRAEALTLLRDALNHALEPALVKQPSKTGGVAHRRRESYVAAVAARHATGMRRGARRPLDAVG